MKRVITIFILLLVAAANSRAEQLPIRAYTTADGLARDGVHKIVTDPRGFLWFCTYDGLSRFDGYEFVNYGIPQGLPHRSVHDLLITRKGDYWVATSAGVARFNAFAGTSEPKFKTYVPTQRPDSEIITDLYEDSSGTIWVGTGNGLFALREIAGDWRFEYVSLGEKDEQLDITTMVEGSPGVLWVGTEQGLFRHTPDGSAERFTTTHGLPHPHARDLLRDPDGTIWVATGLGLCRLVSNVRSGESIVSRLYTKKDGMLSENINALFRTSTGSLWIATTLGLSQFSPDPLPGGGHFINYTREHGLSDVGLNTIAEDHDGNLWLGSESGGAMKVNVAALPLTQKPTGWSTDASPRSARIGAVSCMWLPARRRFHRFTFIGSMAEGLKTFGSTCPRTSSLPGVGINWSFTIENSSGGFRQPTDSCSFHHCARSKTWRQHDLSKYIRQKTD